ncbi:hypothetical protein K4T77_11560 [Staphylococcus epidermidis]|nr:hypothetical protein [Staphylococcus epidermidis]
MEHKFAIDGEFGKWLEKVNLNKSQASKFITIVENHQEEISTSKKSMNILYEIATLPETERTKEYITSKGAKLVKTCHFNTHIERIRARGIYSVRFRNVLRT